MNSRFYCVGEQGVAITGEGSKGRPFRLYLEKSESPYTIIIIDEENDNTEVLRYTNCRTNEVLYYRLKDYYTLTIFNEQRGRFRIL